MKKILLSKLKPETKQEIKDSQADKEVLGNWIEVRRLPETMGKMAVPEVLNSVSAIVMKDITLREGRWRVEYHDSEQWEFFCSMVDGKLKFKGTLLKVRPWIFPYGVEQIWDQPEEYANLERQKSQIAQGFGGNISAVSEKNAPCAFPLEKKIGHRRIRPQTTDGRPQISKPFSRKWTEREIPSIIPSRMDHEMLTNMDGGRVMGSPKERTEMGLPKITRIKAEIQAAQDGPKLVENLVENLVKTVERNIENPEIKMIPR